MMRNFLVKMMGVVFIGLALSACGVKSNPVAPEGATYPAQYPKPLVPIKPNQQPVGRTGQQPLADPNTFWQYPNTPPGQRVN